jgi:hypothetical protein
MTRASLSRCGFLQAAIRWRTIFVRELGEAEGKQILRESAAKR